jgi:hypothetical protein
MKYASCKQRIVHSLLFCIAAICICGPLATYALLQPALLSSFSILVMPTDIDADLCCYWHCVFLHDTQQDLKSTLVPMRARGVVTLTRLLRSIAPQLKAAQQAQQQQQTQQQQQQRPLIVEVIASTTTKSAAETAAAAATLATVDKFMDTYVDMIQVRLVFF